MTCQNIRRLKKTAASLVTAPDELAAVFILGLRTHDGGINAHLIARSQNGHARRVHRRLQGLDKLRQLGVRA